MFRNCHRNGYGYLLGQVNKLLMLFLGTQTSADDLFCTNTPEAPAENVMYNNNADDDAAVGE